MRFAVHGSSAIGGIKIDWDVPVELDPEIRKAMAPHDLDLMQVGVVRRGYAVNKVTYPRGSLAFRVGEAHEIFLQLPDSLGSDAPADAVARPTHWTSESDETCDRHHIVVGSKLDRERADVIIANTVGTISRAAVQRLIDGGRVTVAGQPIKKANQRLRTGDPIEIVLARLVASEATPARPAE